MKRMMMLIVLTAAAGLGGCEKSLFPSDAPRTQYERFDRLHGNYTPQDERNNFGGSEPALRPRLTPYHP